MVFVGFKFVGMVGLAIGEFTHVCVLKVCPFMHDFYSSQSHHSWNVTFYYFTVI